MSREGKLDALTKVDLRLESNLSGKEKGLSTLRSCTSCIDSSGSVHKSTRSQREVQKFSSFSSNLSLDSDMVVLEFIHPVALLGSQKSTKAHEKESKEGP